MGTSKNAPCWCGSGKKFKRCHWPQEATLASERKAEIILPTFEEFLKVLGHTESQVSEEIQNKRLKKVIRDKAAGKRPKPSERFIDKSELLNSDKRRAIIDIAAKYVDENITGRNDMCQQFAMVVKNLLKKEGIATKIYEGVANYYEKDLKFNWTHFWLITENNELIDCNIDSLPENPLPPEGLEPLNYWGPTDNVPTDRKFSHEKEFTDKEEIEFEKKDDETVIWKTKSTSEYELMFPTQPFIPSSD